MASGGSVCRFYKTPGGCWFGDNCRFIHDVNQNNSAARRRQPGGQRCRFYMTPSGCHYGDRCFFKHDDVQVDNLTEQLTEMHVEFVPPLQEKYEQETPEKLKWNQPNDSASLESGQFDSPEGGADGGVEGWRECGDDSEEDNEAVEEKGEEENSLWSEDSDGNRKKWETMKSEKKDRTKPEIEEAVCGECGEEFKSDDAFELLRAHYLENFKKFNYQHLKFLAKNYPFDHTTCCMICNKLFRRSKDLLRHIVDKSKQPTEDGEEHHAFLDIGIVLPFCYRDTVDHDEMKLMEELFMLLVHTYNGSDTDSDDEDFLNFMGLAHMLTKMPHAYMLNMGAEDTSSDESDIGGMFGFSEEDCFELACQGIKPWDPEAGAALAILNGYGF